MPLPNPEIWGAPETWVDTKIMYTPNSYPTIKAGKAKVASFRNLNNGIQQGKFEYGVEPIDSTICPVGQDPAASCFGKMYIIGTTSIPSTDIINPEVIKEFEAPVNWCFTEDGPGTQGWTIRNYFTSMYNGSHYRWSPNTGTISTDFNRNTGVCPFVYYQLKTLLLSIKVLLIDGYSDNYYGNMPYSQSGTWRTLTEWKNNFSDKKAFRIKFDINSVYNADLNNITYQNYDNSFGNFDTASVALLDGLELKKNDSTVFYDYATFQIQAKSRSFELVNAIHGNNDTYVRHILMSIDKFENSTIRATKGTSNDYVYCAWQEIPYTEKNCEAIMKMVACFGVPFTDTNKLTFKLDYTDNELYLPVLGSDGVTHGEYTHGAENIQNQLYNLNSIFDFEPIVPVPAERPEQINVYDINEPQNGFDHNGLAILMPIECISDKEERGRWDLTITHPIDDYDKWTYIIGQNVLKVNGQLFRIDETEIYQDADTAYITAHAKHITYDLFDRFVDELTVENASGNEYIYKVIQRSQEILPTHRPEPNEYSFSISSNITGPIDIKVQDQTVIGALFGDDNSLAVRYGGRLSRDNFSMSINAPQDNSPELPAFKLRFGTDLTKLSYKIDFSDWVTELICEDNLGNLWAVSYVGSEWIIHHQKTRRIHFTYDPDTPDPMGCLEKDGYAYWLTVSTPTVSIEVGVAALKSDPKYKDFVDLQNLDVGYTGSVYIEQYNIDVNMKIVSIRRNELTGEVIQVVLGTARGSLIRSPVMSQTIVANGTVLGKQAKIMQSMQSEIENLKLKQMRTWGGMKAYKWADVQQYTWGEIKNGKK